MVNSIDEVYEALKSISKLPELVDMVGDCEMFDGIRLLNTLPFANFAFPGRSSIALVINNASLAFLTPVGTVKMETFIRLKEIGFNIHRVADEYQPFTHMVTDGKIGILFQS